MEAGRPHLIVDDEKQIASSCADAWRRIPHRGGRQRPTALELLTAERFALVLLDVMMPGMTGYEVCSPSRRGAAIPSFPCCCDRPFGAGPEEPGSAGAERMIPHQASGPAAKLLLRVRAFLRLRHRLHDPAATESSGRPPEHEGRDAVAHVHDNP